MALFSNITNLFGAAGTSAAPAPAAAPQPKDNAPADPITQHKQEALLAARTLAANENRRPSVEDYRQACVTLGEQQGLDAKEWNPKIFADLKGQDLTDFAISEPAKQAPQKRSMSDLMDLDGDGAINDFYTNVDFTGADLKNAYVDPATSFNDEIAKAANLKGITFNGMENGDRFLFASGQYSDINLTNVNGGEIVFATGTQVDGLVINGQSAAVTLEPKAVASRVSVNDHFRIVKLDVGEGAVISNSDLSNATISMASNLEGSYWQNVKLSANLQGVDLSGANLKNVEVDGKAITRPDELRAYGVTIDANTKVEASPDFLIANNMQQALAKATSVAMEAKNWMSPGYQPEPSQAPQQAPTREREAGGASMSYYAQMSNSGGRSA